VYAESAISFRVISSCKKSDETDLSIVDQNGARTKKLHSGKKSISK